MTTEHAEGEDLRFAVFGGVRAWRDGQEVELGPAKQRALLAALLLADGRPVPSRGLEAFVWTAPPLNATSLIQTYVSRLRKIVGRACLVLDPGGYRLRHDPARVDLHRFRTLRDRAELGPAFAVVAGAPCADLGAATRAHPAIVAVERELVEAAIAYAVADHADLDDVTRVLEWVATMAPLDEALFARLIRVYAESGRGSDALLTYDRIRRRLRDELGVLPGPELTDAHRTALDAPSPQPAETTPLVGRRRELQALAETVRDSRVTTLVGPPGVGKTAVALALAARAEDAVVVRLGELAEDGDVAAALLASVGVAAADPVAAVPAALRDRRALLVLDGAERVVAACAALAGVIAYECPDVTVLVTSRRPLGLPGEEVRELAPLDMSDAAGLFLRGARRSPTDRDVAELCRRLDGLPLAILRAAAGPTGASLGALADRALDSMAEPVGRSLALLTPDQRTLLARLALIDGPFTLADVEWAAREIPEPVTVLGDLIEHSLVHRASDIEDGYRILGVIRKFGLADHAA
ncbi:winged helix-turn-helix domain-containing protein [Streptosporangiaceae bacterium NEAU-GS5]|nr:winged helix-turn-helix domain-containing protein [Streptosporangiaceae bacterium NEAU-GS5]